MSDIARRLYTATLKIAFTMQSLLLAQMFLCSHVSLSDLRSTLICMECYAEVTAGTTTIGSCLNAPYFSRIQMTQDVKENPQSGCQVLEASYDVSRSASW